MTDSIRLDKAGKTWDEGLPIGNGRLGAMITGKVGDESIFINEETLWYGPMRNRKNPDAKSHIDKIRHLLLNGDIEEAAFLAKMSMTSTPKYNNPYQPAGDLKLSFKSHNGNVENYVRSLSLDKAMATVTYTLDGVKHGRDHFVSADYNVLVIRLWTEDSEGITLGVNMNRKPFEEYTGKIGSVTVGNWGECGAGGVRYLTGVRMTAKSVIEGEVAPVWVLGDFVYTRNAKEVVIYLTCSTDYEKRYEAVSKGLGYHMGTETDHCPDDLLDKVNKGLDRAVEAGYERLLKSHLETYGDLYHRFSLNINNSKSPSLPMNEIMAGIREGKRDWHDATTVILVDFARYLMISSSYNCLMPSNLQGLWNGSYIPPWMSQYTININTEMNYWFVEKVNLPECHLPLFEQIKRMLANGRETAKEIYGCRGFCAHHNTNLWATTDIEGIFDTSPFWPSGAAWLSLHLYEHYRFTGDRIFLADVALPIMREAILFFEDYLYETDDGLLLSGPSLSPENSYRSDKGEKGALCMAPTMDSMLVRQLVNEYLEGKKLVDSLAEEEENRLRVMVNQLPEVQIGKDGRILEWYKEVEELEPGHRHISHMYGLHPGYEILEESEDLFEAASKTIDSRLAHKGGHTGWSKAWLSCFMSRLKRGEDLNKNLFEMKQKSILDNLLDIHPPFQIDGNFGFAEAVIEGLVQSHGPYIEILPALPKEWVSGHIQGLVLRGGIFADIHWNDGRLKECNLTAKEDIEIKVKYMKTIKKICLHANETLTLEEDFFCQEAGKLVIH